MPENFLCYLHKPGVMVPELRVLYCTPEDLPRTLVEELRTWGIVDLVEVYGTSQDEPLYRLGTDGPAN